MHRRASTAGWPRKDGLAWDHLYAPIDPAAVDAVQASASKQASNMPRGMWAAAAALAAHELRSEVQIRLVLIVRPAA